MLTREVRKLGLKGLKLHAVPTPEILETVAELGIPILIHPPRVGDCLEVVRSRPKINFILAHLGSFASRDYREHLLATTAVALAVTFGREERPNALPDRYGTTR